MTHPIFEQDATLKARVLEGIDATGKNDITEIPVGIEIVSMDLQKLFVQLTNS